MDSVICKVITNIDLCAIVHVMMTISSRHGFMVSVLSEKQAIQEDILIPNASLCHTISFTALK